MKCSKCWNTVSFWKRDLATGQCEACRREAEQAEAARVKSEAAEAERAARGAAERRYRAAERGEATPEEAELLEADGHVVVIGRLVRCPVGGHDRFHRQRTLMNTRAATFFNLDWADRGADTCICQRCTHVLWFAR